MSSSIWTSPQPSGLRPPRRWSGRRIVLVVAVGWLFVGFMAVGLYAMFVEGPRDAAIAAAVAPACLGQPVPGAGTPAGGTPSHVVVLDRTGGPHEWSDDVSSDWHPGSLADAELAVCLDARETRTQVQVCGYSGGPDVTRYEVSRAVEVRIASSGQLLRAFTAAGEPQKCAEHERIEVTELVGELGWGQVADQLAFLVSAGNPDLYLKLSAPVTLSGGLFPEVAFLMTNTGPEPLDVDWHLTYASTLVTPSPSRPTGSGEPNATSQDETVVHIAPGEVRVVIHDLPDFDWAANVPVRIAITGVAPARQDRTERLRTELTLTPPELPIDPINPAATLAVSNNSDEDANDTATIAFLDGDTIVAVAHANVSVSAHATSKAELIMWAGDAASATRVIAQIDTVGEP